MFESFSELFALGLSPFFVQQLHEAPEGVLGRVACERRGQYEIQTAQGVLQAALSGRLLHVLPEDDRPTVGDWVVLQIADPVCRVEHVLERQGVLRRASVDGSSRAQNLAANVDLCCIVAACSNGDVHTRRRALNPNRIQRYLTTAENCRIPALVWLNKADVLSPEEAEAARDELLSVLPHARVLLLSARTGLGLAELRAELPRGNSAVLLGSSGVGKSTIVNALLGSDVQNTSPERADDSRGRHTTTERQLLQLAHGGLLIDTPGMRELALWADADDEASPGFADIAAFAEHCHFRDCQHQGEPGCAVEAAIDAGQLGPERLAQLHKLERELRHQRARVDVRLRQAEHNRWKLIGRANRKRQRLTGKT